MNCMTTLSSKGVLLYCFLTPCLSQPGFSTFGGAESSSLGLGGVACSGSGALFANPAGCIALTSPVLSLASEQRVPFGLMGRSSLAGALPLRLGTVAAGITQMTVSGYTEQKCWLSYVRSIGPRVAASLQADWLAERADGIGSRSRLVAEVGFQAVLSSSLRAGLHLFHPGGLLWSGGELESRMRAGVQFSVSPSLFLSMDIDKPAWRNWVIRSGVGYSPSPHCWVYMGVVPSQGRVSVGVKYKPLTSLAISLATSVDQNLGAASGVTLTYEHLNSGKSSSDRAHTVPYTPVPLPFGKR